MQHISTYLHHQIFNMYCPLTVISYICQYLQIVLYVYMIKLLSNLCGL
jgi:hypothetical protein